MTAIFHAHSGLRFLILLLGAVDVVVFAVAMAQHKPFTTVHRILGAAFVGCLHLQVLLGVALVAMGTYYPKLIGHMVCMALATVVAQLGTTLNRRRPTPGFRLPLLGVLGALLLIFAGVMAIGRGLFTMST